MTENNSTAPLKTAEMAICERCAGSGEDPEGFLTTGRGPNDYTVDGPCRQCGGSGEAVAAQAPEALRLADERPHSIDDDLYAWSQSAEQVIRAQHAEIQQIKAVVQHQVISGALFDFAGYLTTLPREESFPVGGCHEASPMVSALKTWAKNRSLNLDEAEITNWVNAMSLATQPSADVKWQEGYEFGRQRNKVDSDNAALYMYLRNHCLKIKDADRDGPAHPHLVFSFDEYAANPETHNVEGLDAAIKNAML